MKKIKKKKTHASATAKPPATKNATKVRPQRASNQTSRSFGNPPLPAKNAEIITRQGFLIDATGKGPHAVPEVVLLANGAGLAYLADLFLYLADFAAEFGEELEAAIVGLPRNEHPINVRLSDDLAFRFALLTEVNRRQMFKKFGIDMASRQKGSLFERYQEVVTHFGRLQNMMRREGLTTPATENNR